MKRGKDVRGGRKGGGMGGWGRMWGGEGGMGGGGVNHEFLFPTEQSCNFGKYCLSLAGWVYFYLGSTGVQYASFTFTFQLFRAK
jgi:hypothetical protein